MPDDEPAQKPAQPATPLPVLPVLGYADSELAREGDLVTIGHYNNNTQAAVELSALEAAGIPCVLQNQNVGGLGWYSVAVPVELQVRRSDVTRAGEVLKAAISEDLEPADEDATQANDPNDPESPTPVVIAAFEPVRAMRDAAVLLESARVPALLPNLVPRGDRPIGQGKRFI